MFKYSTSILATLLLALLPITSAKNASTTYLNQWPMIMSHDAATTYLSSGIFNDWIKTQPSGGASGLLDCGARALDWRPALQKDGSLFMHHNFVVIKHKMKDAMDEMIEWAGRNKNGASDLVFLGVTACKGDGCIAAVETLLATYNISFLNNEQLATMTVEDAVKYGKLTNGGSIIACESCWNEHFNSAISCSGFGSGTDVKSKETNDELLSLEYTCYADSSTKAAPLNRMWSYLSNTTAIGPLDGQMWTAQALWQEDAQSVTVGTLHDSSLLKDESKSGLNGLLKDRILSGTWNVSKINMVEINNVCDGGVELKKVLDGIK